MVSEESFPDMGTQDAVDMFLAQYQAHFGPHPAAAAFRKADCGVARQERRIWRTEIDKCEPRHFEQLVELMALDLRERERGGKPKVSDLRTARLKIENRYHIATSGAPPPDCGLCYGSGMICVPAAAPSAERKGWVIGDPSKAVLHETAFPCRCSAGKKQSETTFRSLPADVATRAWEYLLGALEACGAKDGDAPMSLRKYLLAPREGYAPRTLMAQTVTDSLRMDAERRGDPSDAFPSLPKSVTLDELRKRVARPREPQPQRRARRSDMQPIGEVAFEDVERAAIQAVEREAERNAEPW